MPYKVYICFDDDNNIKYKDILWVADTSNNEVYYYLFISNTWKKSSASLFALQQQLTEVGSVLEKDQALSIFRMYQLTED